MSLKTFTSMPYGALTVAAGLSTLELPVPSSGIDAGAMGAAALGLVEPATADDASPSHDDLQKYLSITSIESPSSSAGVFSVKELSTAEFEREETNDLIFHLLSFQQQLKFPGDSYFFTKAHLDEIRSLVAALSDNARYDFKLGGFESAYPLFRKFGFGPFQKIAEANPERAGQIMLRIADLSELVWRVGMEPFVRIATEYKEADWILWQMRGEDVFKYRDGLGQSQTRFDQSMTEGIRSAEELLYYARAISGFREATSHIGWIGDGRDIRLGPIVKRYGITSLAALGRIVEETLEKTLQVGNRREDYVFWNRERLLVHNDQGNREILTDEDEWIASRCGFDFLAELLRLVPNEVSGFGKYLDEVLAFYPTPQEAIAFAEGLGTFSSIVYVDDQHERLRFHTANDLIDGLFGHPENKALLETLGIGAFRDAFVAAGHAPDADAFACIAAAAHVIKVPSDLASVVQAYAATPDRSLLVAVLPALKHLFGSPEQLKETFLILSGKPREVFTALPPLAHLLKGIGDLSVVCDVVQNLLNKNQPAVTLLLPKIAHDLSTFEQLREFASLAEEAAHIGGCDTDAEKQSLCHVMQYCKTLDDLRQWVGLMKASDDPRIDTSFMRFTRLPLATSTHLPQLLKIFRAVRKEVGITPARREEAFALLRDGLPKWRPAHVPEGIPDFFLFQTLAVANDDRQLAAMRKLLDTKKMRNSRDERKAVMWFLEDHRENARAMREFYRLIEISSSKGMSENLRMFGILLLIDPAFTLEGIADQEQFREKASGTIRAFIGGKTQSEAVRARFLEQLDHLHQTGFLQAIVTLYSKFENRPDALPLLDITLAAIVMGDFEKIKFPTPEAVARLTYLTSEQRAMLLRATDQLGMLSIEQHTLWKENLEVKKVADQDADEVSRARQDIGQRIRDLKYHLEQHLHSRPGTFERAFSWSAKPLTAIEKQLAASDATSPDAIKLREFKKLIGAVQWIESLDLAEVKQREAEVREHLRSLAQVTRNLFMNFYGFDEEKLQSLQAKMDIGLLREMLFGNLERLKIRGLEATDSADSLHLLLAGKEPENSGSCQRYDGTPELMIGLLGYLLNAGSKIIRVKNQDGIVVGRAILRVVEGNGTPLLFLERAYYRNAQSNADIDAAIIDLAMKKAEAMGVKLVTTWQESEHRETLRIVKRRGLSPYEYTDGLVGENGAGGVLKGEYSRDLEVSILRDLPDGPPSPLPPKGARTQLRSAETFLSTR